MDEASKTEQLYRRAIDEARRSRALRDPARLKAQLRELVADVSEKARAVSIAPATPRKSNGTSSVIDQKETERVDELRRQ
jgi:hypothetical protein